jgi:iron(II)-dependent oxidoreductase
MFCPKCGTENRPNARFCKSCGHAFAGTETGKSAPLTGASPFEHTFVLRSVGPDDPGRTNFSLPSLATPPEEPSSTAGRGVSNDSPSDGFILGDISSPNLKLDLPSPAVEQLPPTELFSAEAPISPFRPTLVPPAPLSSSPATEADATSRTPTLDPLSTHVATPAGGAPTVSPPPPTLHLPLTAPPSQPAGGAFSTTQTGKPDIEPSAALPPTPPPTPTPPSGVPLPPEVAATPFRPVDLPVGAPRPMGHQLTEMPALPPKPPGDLFPSAVQKASTVELPRQAKFPLWLVVGLSVAVLVVLIVGVSVIVYWRSSSSPVPVTSEAPATKPEPPATSPKPVIPENMVAIPGGEYLIGRDEGDFLDPYEKPQHTVILRPFYIDKTEVTNADYQKFVEATGHPAPASWVGGRFEPGKELFPVTGVTLADAEAYARWAGKRLPTEEEWEVAAHGRTPTAFPWGNTFDPSRANVKASGLGVPVRVGTYPSGASPFGVLDMTGNVWEWTASEAKLYPGSNEKPPSWDKPLEPGVRLQIIRGGAFTEETRRCTVTYRNWVPSDFKSRELGFRCVQDQPPQ